MKFRSFLLGLSLTLATVASADSIGEPGLKWKEKVINTCWMNDLEMLNKNTTWTDFSARVTQVSEARRELVKRTILSNFTPELTGMTITGFGDCPTGPELENYNLWLANDISIIDARVIAGISSIGDVRVSPQKPGIRVHPATGFNFIDTEEAIRTRLQSFLKRLFHHFPVRFNRSARVRQDVKKFLDTVVAEDRQNTILHEMGHAFGLRHEEVRTDAPKAQDYTFCGFAGDHWLEGESPKGRYSTFGTKFDLFSVMNYCRDGMLELQQRARLVCGWRGQWERGTKVAPDVRTALKAVYDHCDFIEVNEFPQGLTASDRAGLRKMYLDIEPKNLTDRDYRSSPTKVRWVEVLRTVDRLLSALLIDENARETKLHSVP